MGEVEEVLPMSLIVAESVAQILGLGAKVRTSRQLESAVSAGLPKRSLTLVTTRLYPDKKAAQILTYKIVPNATWKRRRNKLSPAESEKTERLARVLAVAEHVFRDKQEAREWMSTPHPEMDAMAPADVARTELGARRVEDILGRIIYGLPV
jgi:putative toxin-antitoxin system antitoxin component (TIGR02293 family)